MRAVALICGVLLAGTACVAQDNLPPPVAAAVEALAGYLHIEPAQVKVVDLEEVTWPDASLGVPEPGKMYAQVLVKGYRVTLEATGRRFEYHTDMTVRAVRVPTEQMAPAAGEGEQPDVVGKAVEDLSARLGIEPDQITVISAEERQWPNPALGLEEPGMMYAQVITPGYFIVLQAAGHQYAYHASQSGAKPAGIYVPDDASPDVLAMVRTEPRDGNNFFELQRIGPMPEGNAETIFPALSGFTATPDGRSIALVVRTSRSSHSLLLWDGEGEPTQVDMAFDFGLVCFSPLGERLAYFKRENITVPDVTLEIYDVGSGQVAHRIVPKVEGGQCQWQAMVWTLGGLVFTVSAADGPPHTFGWNGTETTPVGDGLTVMGWIPGTGSVLVRTAGDEGRQALGAIHVPGGDLVTLLQAPQVVSAAALPGQHAVLAVVSDNDGALKLVRATWGGAVEELMPIVAGGEVLELLAGPAGGLVTLGYIVGDQVKTDVLAVDETATKLMTLDECLLAAPIGRYPLAVTAPAG